MRMRECAVHADCAHIREYADADENLIHTIHIVKFAKNTNFLGQKWVQPGSVISSEFPKYHYRSFLLVLSILRNNKTRVQNHNILVNKM